MQWLTAILAFATTMLVFAIVVTAIVEVIHRVLGSRMFGLIAMLEHYYDDVLSDFEGVDREKFVTNMVRLRAPGISKSGTESIKFKQAKTQGLRKIVGWVFGLIPRALGLLPQLAKSMYSYVTGTSKIASELGHSQWRLLEKLPVETFMERLGSLGYLESLESKAKNEAEKSQLLDDLAQKFELYGRESSLYFERKASSISVIIALLVAWIFYVHPYDLIQTYMQNPAIAAQVAELSDDTLQRHEAQKKSLEELKKAQQANSAEDVKLDELLDKLNEEIESGKKQAARFAQTGAPVGWPEDSTKVRIETVPCHVTVGIIFNPSRTFFKGCKIDIYIPRASKDIFWLLIGGVLIGLGAPFWAKTITRISQVKDETQKLRAILQPDKDQASGASSRVSGSANDTSLTTRAFQAAAGARKIQGGSEGAKGLDTEDNPDKAAAGARQIQGGSEDAKGPDTEDNPDKPDA